jgi:hypothetical protein
MGKASKVGKRVFPVAVYAPERKAEFLLTDAVNQKDYRQAQAEVRRMGLDASKIAHRKPPKR